MDPDPLNPDPDPDTIPAFQVNPDPDPIRSFDNRKLKKKIQQTIVYVVEDRI
jgi:hypothetical protein